MVYTAVKALENGAPGVERDDAAAAKVYERCIAEEGNNYDAMYRWGRILGHGVEGVQIDNVRSIELLGRAFEGGIEGAMRDLALPLQGIALDYGVDNDINDVLGLCEKAISERNNIDAMVNVGIILMHGAGGFERDVNRAVSLFERAIEKGAMYNLAIVLEGGVDGIEKDI